jgi:hypothetical protein
VIGRPLLVFAETCERVADNASDSDPPVAGGGGVPPTACERTGPTHRARNKCYRWYASRPWSMVIAAFTVALGGSATTTVRSPALQRARRAR